MSLGERRDPEESDASGTQEETNVAELVTVERRGDGVAVVRLDDQGAKLNTLSRQAIDESRRQGERSIPAADVQHLPSAADHSSGVVRASLPAAMLEDSDPDTV